ncbi:hypothetical protein [Marinifilum breve]
MLDIYRIREWVENKPITHLTDRELNKYTVVAL